MGQRLAMLVNEATLGGRYEVKWDAHEYASGIYFYRLQAGEFVETKKLIVLK